MRKDVREALMAEREAKPKRPAIGQLRRGKHTTGILRAPKAIVCAGCGAALTRDDAYRTARGAWCETCSVSFVPEPQSAPVNQPVNSIPTEIANLSPVGLLPRKAIRRLLPKSEPKLSQVPIPEVELAEQLGIRRQRNIPCDQCGRFIIGTPYHLSNGRFCSDCVTRAGIAEARREQSRGDYLDLGAPQWIAPPVRPPVGTTLHAGDRIWDWVKQEWLTVVSCENGYDVAKRLAAPWWMFNPERAFRFLHGELFESRVDTSMSWRRRPIPEYASVYQQTVA